MEIHDVISADRCRVLHSRTKTEALLELIEIVGEENSVADLEALKKEIFYREQIMSTGIGQGIGIPHVRFPGMKEPIVLVGVSPKGLEDYESLDGEIVKLVFMILVDENHHKEYLRILSLIVQRLKDDGFRKGLFGAETDKAVFELLTGGEK